MFLGYSECFVFLFLSLFIYLFCLFALYSRMFLFTYFQTPWFLFLLISLDSSIFYLYVYVNHLVFHVSSSLLQSNISIIVIVNSLSGSFTIQSVDFGSHDGLFCLLRLTFFKNVLIFCCWKLERVYRVASMEVSKNLVWGLCYYGQEWSPTFMVAIGSRGFSFPLCHWLSSPLSGASVCILLLRVS